MGFAQKIKREAGAGGLRPPNKRPPFLFEKRKGDKENQYLNYHWQ